MFQSKKIRKNIVISCISLHRIRYNIVTLEIVESIMKNCSSYFETFCPSALTILFHMLQSQSYTLAVRSLQTVYSVHLSLFYNIYSLVNFAHDLRI